MSPAQSISSTNKALSTAQSAPSIKRVVTDKSQKTDTRDALLSAVLDVVLDTVFDKPKKRAYWGESSYWKLYPFHTKKNTAVTGAHHTNCKQCHPDPIITHPKGVCSTCHENIPHAQLRPQKMMSDLYLQERIWRGVGPNQDFYKEFLYGNGPRLKRLTKLLRISDRHGGAFCQDALYYANEWLLYQKENAKPIFKPVKHRHRKLSSEEIKAKEANEGHWQKIESIFAPYKPVRADKLIHLWTTHSNHSKLSPSAKADILKMISLLKDINTLSTNYGGFAQKSGLAGDIKRFLDALWSKSNISHSKPFTDKERQLAKKIGEQFEAVKWEAKMYLIDGKCKLQMRINSYIFKDYGINIDLKFARLLNKPTLHRRLVNEYMDNNIPLQNCGHEDLTEEIHLKRYLDSQFKACLSCHTSVTFEKHEIKGFRRHLRNFADTVKNTLFDMSSNQQIRHITTTMDSKFKKRFLEKHKQMSIGDIHDSNYYVRSDERMPYGCYMSCHLVEKKKAVGDETDDAFDAIMDEKKPKIEAPKTPDIPDIIVDDDEDEDEDVEGAKTKKAEVKKQPIEPKKMDMIGRGLSTVPCEWCHAPKTHVKMTDYDNYAMDMRPSDYYKLIDECRTELTDVVDAAAPFGNKVQSALIFNSIKSSFGLPALSTVGLAEIALDIAENFIVSQYKDFCKGGEKCASEIKKIADQKNEKIKAMAVKQFCKTVRLPIRAVKERLLALKEGKYILWGNDITAMLPKLDVLNGLLERPELYSGKTALPKVKATFFDWLELVESYKDVLNVPPNIISRERNLRNFLKASLR